MDNQTTNSPLQKPVENNQKEGIGVDKIDELSVQNSTEVSKQLIWICSGFSIFLLTSVFTLLNSSQNSSWIIFLPVICLIPFLVSIIGSILFLLAIIARTAHHRDTNLFSNACINDIKIAFISFIIGIICVFASVTIIVSLNVFILKQDDKKTVGIKVPATFIYNNDTNSILIEIDSLRYQSK